MQVETLRSFFYIISKGISSDYLLERWRDQKRSNSNIVYTNNERVEKLIEPVEWIRRLYNNVYIHLDLEGIYRY